jgi:hypothetical protein
VLIKLHDSATYDDRRKAYAPSIKMQLISLKVYFLRNQSYRDKSVSGFQEPYARKFNSLIVASDSRICPDKIDSLKSKPSTTRAHYPDSEPTSLCSLSLMLRAYHEYV